MSPQLYSSCLCEHPQKIDRIPVIELYSTRLIDWRSIVSDRQESLKGSTTNAVMAFLNCLRLIMYLYVSKDWHSAEIEAEWFQSEQYHNILAIICHSIVHDMPQSQTFDTNIFPIISLVMRSWQHVNQSCFDCRLRLLSTSKHLLRKGADQIDYYGFLFPFVIKQFRLDSVGSQVNAVRKAAVFGPEPGIKIKINSKHWRSTARWMFAVLYVTEK